MAVSHFKVEQYRAEHFVESAGAIISYCKSKRACLLHHLAKDEWLLPKGRRNARESRQEKVLREVRRTRVFGLALFAQHWISGTSGRCGRGRDLRTSGSSGTIHGTFQAQTSRLFGGISQRSWSTLLKTPAKLKSKRCRLT